MLLRAPLGGAAISRGDSSVRLGAETIAPFWGNHRRRLASHPLAGATASITGSGGSQEECSYLDIPCLVHRVRTERRERIRENAVLSGLRVDVLREVLADPGRHRRRTSPPAASPTCVIVDDLARRGIV
jgi:hypothetical protein